MYIFGSMKKSHKSKKNCELLQIVLDFLCKYSIIKLDEKCFDENSLIRYIKFSDFASGFLYSNGNYARVNRRFHLIFPSLGA